MICHLFHQIDRVLCPKEDLDINRKDSISLKNLGQGDWKWSAQETVIGWDLDTNAHLMCLPPRRQEKVAATLAAIPG